MNWRDPKLELPKHNQVVAILIYHWKQNWPQSAEIYFGTTYHYPEKEFPKVDPQNRICVENCDMTGGGSQRWYFNIELSEADRIAAWCHAKDFQMPKFLNHDKHWGEPFSAF